MRPLRSEISAAASSPFVEPSAGDHSPSFAEATLAEHFRHSLRLERFGGAFADEVLRFLGVEDRETFMTTSIFPLCDLPQVHAAVRKCLPDWRGLFDGGTDAYHTIWSPRTRRVQIAPGKWREYLLRGTRFFELPDGSRRVALFDTDEHYDPRRIEFSLIAPRSEARDVRRTMRALRQWCRRNHYLRGQTINASGQIIADKMQADWDDLVLPPALMETLRRQVVDFLRLRRTFRRNGIPQRRGLLLYGPPGNGKTTVGRVLAGLSRVTFVYATAADITTKGVALRSLFALARRLRPAILFLEDLDFYASERNGGQDPAVLGELLAQLDGLERNDGLIVLGTTNDLGAIEPAIKDRPSRFDVVLEVPMPGADCRRRLLTRFFSRVKFAETCLAYAVDHTDGCSGAQLRELAARTVQEAIFRGAVDDDEVAVPEQSDVEAALAHLLGGRKKAPLGFAAELGARR